MMRNFGLDKEEEKADLGLDEGKLLRTINDPRFNEEIITPYVIINKTDMALIVKRLFEKKEASTGDATAPNVEELSAAQRRQQLINYYRLEEGQVIDYMVDY